MWRPKDWEETLREILDSFNVTYMNSDECKLIEAGADAMLELLKRDAAILTGDSVIPASGNYPEIHVPTGMKGWLAYIPDEE